MHTPEHLLQCFERKRERRGRREGGERGERRERREERNGERGWQRLRSMMRALIHRPTLAFIIIYNAWREWERNGEREREREREKEFPRVASTLIEAYNSKVTYKNITTIYATWETPSRDFGKHYGMDDVIRAETLCGFQLMSRNAVVIWQFPSHKNPRQLSVRRW